MRKLHRSPCMVRRINRLLMQATIVGFLFTAMPFGIVSAQQDFDSVFDKANLFYRQGKYEEAISLYKKANGMKGNASLECLWGLAQVFSKIGAHKNTLQTCDRLIQIAGSDIGFLAKAWNLRGNTLSAVAVENPKKPDEAKLREAETAFREVLKFGAGLNMAHYNLGITLIRLNRLDEGLGELRTYIDHADEEDIAEIARKIIDNPRRVVENYAPDFSILTSDGEYISSDELRGKVLLLDFWGTWCIPCRNAIPYLLRLAKKYNKEAFTLISVDVNDDEALWREFITTNKMNWTHTRDGNSKIQRLFQISAFPSYILIDHEGIIRYRGKGSGLQTEGEIGDAVKKALKTLAASPVQQKSGSGESRPPIATAPSSTPHKDPADNSVTLNLPANVSVPLKNEAKKVYTFRIPKPVIEVTVANQVNMPEQIQNANNVYMLRINNWASLPDELFSSSKDLMPCSVDSSLFTMANTASTRLELSILNEKEQKLRVYCNLPRPEILQNLLLMIPKQVGPGKIYVMLKDRLTGNSVQSDLASLP